MSDEKTRNSDSIAVMLRNNAQYVLVILFGLLPILFVPSLFAPFNFSKLVIALVAVFLALVLYSLSVLRTGVITIGISYPLIILWLLVGVSVASAILSGDLYDSLIGDVFAVQTSTDILSVHTSMFLAVLALIPTVWLLLRPKKEVVLRMYILLSVSTLILVVFHIARVVFGADALTLGVFSDPKSTPVGSWNDLALFLGLTVTLSLIALEQLVLSKIGRLLFVAVALLSLVMLGIINFFMVWVVLGLTSLALVVYAIGKDRFTGGQLPLIATQRASSLPVALIVCAVSVLFIVGGSQLSAFITGKTGLLHIEMRPSVTTTLDIARQVYEKDPVLGIGPNKFIDAWRFYKPPALNLTDFWSTDFTAGHSYIGTFFITTGILGGTLWIVFIAVYLVSGIRRLIAPVNTDRIWYFIAASSFVSAVYVWGMSLIYVPGLVILLMGALCTGVSLYAFTILDAREERLLTIVSNRRTGFVLTLVILVIIIGSVGALYTIGRQYSSVVSFNNTLQNLRDGEVADIPRQLTEAYNLFPSDVFARTIADYQLGRLNTLITVQQPTVEQQREFEEAFVVGKRAAEEAIALDPTEAQNWRILGGIYAVVGLAGFQGGAELALEAFGKARLYNPLNPLPLLESAVVEARLGNYDVARGHVSSAIKLKPNFIEAVQLLTELEIAQNNLEGAIAATLAGIKLEPQNPIRYYQLGVLESAGKNLDGAIAAFEKVVALDTNHANARYSLAFLYDIKGRSGDARAQLEVVLELNPGNQQVTELISIINTEGSLARLRGEVSTVLSEEEPRTDDKGNVSVSKEADTNIVTPVNTVPASENVEEEP